jgi:hypothetical protein
LEKKGESIEEKEEAMRDLQEAPTSKLDSEEPTDCESTLTVWDPTTDFFPYADCNVISNGSDRNAESDSEHVIVMML